MGNINSDIQSNDELVDCLVNFGMIRNQTVERVFRAVDRGIFCATDIKEMAYSDEEFKNELVHLSSPSLYATALEELQLQAGQSFLNIGSGTGYFSTMVGLILEQNGINHNIEVSSELISYCKSKIGEFIKKSEYFDDFEFCIPKITHGNIINLNFDEKKHFLYDRIYVGVDVASDLELMKKIHMLVKVNGIIVMPMNGDLFRIQRINESRYNRKHLLISSFTTLNDKITPSFNLLEPPSLQAICRSQIRKSIRDRIKSDHNDYYKIIREYTTFNNKTYERHWTIFEFTSEEENENDEETMESTPAKKKKSEEQHIENTETFKRDNLLYERIMGLPLSIILKRFLLFNREK